MKIPVSLLAAVLFSASLNACATTGPGIEKAAKDFEQNSAEIRTSPAPDPIR